MALDAFNTGMTVFLGTNVSKFKKDMAEASSSVGQFGSSVTGTLRGIVGLSTSIQGATIAAGLAMGGLAAIAAHAAGELETQMNNVATVWDEDGQRAEGTLLSLGKATGQLVDLSTQLPQSATELAAALYDVASSGFQGTDAMTVMNASAKAASAGLTTTTVAVRGITAVLNAYGMGADQARSVSDTLFTTVNLGVVTFEELSSVMGDFIGMAATAGVPLEEANAALATMTLNGISASESSTSLNRVLQEFIEPTKSLGAALSALGYESGVLALKEEGLHGIMTKLSALVGGENVEAFAAMFDETRAVKGVLALLADDGKNYADIVGKMTDETQAYNATQKALDKQSQSTGYQITLLKNTVQAIAIDFGQLLLPAVRFVAEALGDFAAGFRALPDWIKMVVFGGGVLVGILGVLAGLWISNKITSMLFGLAMNTVTTALNAAGVSAVWVTRVIHGLKIAMGVIGVLLTAASVAMVIFGKSQDDVGAGQEELQATLDKTTGAINAQTGAFVRDRAVKEGWLDDAKSLGISADDLTAALLGNGAAIDRVNAARQVSVDIARAAMLATKGDQAASEEANHALNDRIEASDRLGDAVKDTNKDVKAGTATVIEEARALKVDESATKGLTTARQQEQEAALAQAEAHIAAIETIQTELDSVFSLSDAYTAAQEASKEAAAAGDNKKADQARAARHTAETDLLDDILEAERDHLDKVQALRQQTLADQQDAERNAFETVNRDYKRALDERRRLEDAAYEESSRARQKALADQQRVEQDALDLRLRSEENHHDDRLRLERQAFDRRMEEIRDQNDELIEEEDEAWVNRQDVIQSMIDSTFGVEREGWKQLLKDEEDAYEDRVDSLEEAGEAKVQSEENIFDDALRVAEQGWDDYSKTQQDALSRQQADRDEALRAELEAERTGVEIRRRMEDEAWNDLIALDATKMELRHRDQTRGLATTLGAEVTHMEARHEARKRGLEKIQTAEDNAADVSLAKSKEKHIPTMAEIQRQIGLELEQRKQFYADQITIATQGGKDMNAAVLAEIVKLGPDAVRVIAASGAAAISGLATSVANGMSQQDTGAIERALSRWGHNAGVGFVNGFNGVLASAPVAVGGMFGGLVSRPTLASADGNFFGPERHVAQIAPAGAWRVWAEPETGGEAYIPLARGKRGTSIPVLARTAHALGYGLVAYAGGGIVGGDGGIGGTVIHFAPTISVQTRVAADVDAGKVHALVGAEVNGQVAGAFNDLARRVVVKGWRN